MRRLIGTVLRRAAPRTIANLEALERVEADGLGLEGRLAASEEGQAALERRFEALDALIVELREELDEARAERRRTAELHALVVDRLATLDPL